MPPLAFTLKLLVASICPIETVLLSIEQYQCYSTLKQFLTRLGIEHFKVRRGSNHRLSDLFVCR